MTEIMSDFLKFELLQSSLDLEDAGEDAKLREIVAEANQEVDSQIKPYTPTTPIEPGTIIFGQLQKVALH